MNYLQTVLAIDPGPVESAWCRFDGQTIEAAKEPNDALLRRLINTPAGILAVEMVACYGMAVGAEVFDTCLWAGRFYQRWRDTTGNPVRLVKRLECKMHLCHDSRARDPHVRQALIDRLGAPGTKRQPGRTYGLTGDCWAALAVAVVALETVEPLLAVGAARRVGEGERQS